MLYRGPPWCLWGDTVLRMDLISNNGARKVLKTPCRTREGGCGVLIVSFSDWLALAARLVQSRSMEFQ